MFLRQSTATTLRFGPIVDATDGVTPETGLTISQADLRISKAGGDFAQVSASGNATHDEGGWYTREFSTTDLNTVGEWILYVNESGAAPFWARYWVLEEAVYDALYASGATGLLPANVTQFGGNAGTFSGGRPEVNVSHWRGSQPNTLQSGRVDSYVGAVASGVIAAASFAAGALDAVWSTSARTLTSISGLASEIRAALGLASADLDTQLGGIASDVSSIDSGVTGVANDVDSLGLALAGVGSDIDALAADVATLLGRTVLLVGTAQGAGTGADTLQLASGQVTGDDALNGLLIVLLRGAGAPNESYILDSTQSTNEVQVAGGAWDEAVDNTTVYAILSN